MVLLSVLCVAASAQFYVPAAQPVAYTARNGAALTELPRVALRGAPVQAVPASANGTSALQPLFFLGAGCAAGWALFSLLGEKAQPAPRRTGDLLMGEGYMYDKPYAPEGMGQEYINEDVRKPLEAYVGASEEFNLGAYFKGEKNFEPWDPWDLCKLSKVSANNPDVAFLREAELKHGRIAMMAFVGILFTEGNTHFPAEAFEAATAAGWPNALGAIAKSNPGIVAQALGAIGIIEGWSNTRRGKWWDGLWFGEKEGSGVVAGDLGFDPLKLMPKDQAAADKMRLKELKN